MVNQELSEIFSQLAQMLEFLGDPTDKFRIRAYQNVAMALNEVSESLETLVKEKRLREIPGVGEGIAKKIEEYIATGRVKEFDVLKKTVPKGFFELIAIPSLGPKKVHVLYRELQIKNVLELKRAVEKGLVQKLDGFGEQSAKKILEGIAIKTEAKSRRPIGEVFLLVEDIVRRLENCRDIDAVSPAGSFRRCEETVGDIDILATGKNHKKIMAYFLKQNFVSKILNHGDTKSTILTRDGLQVDLRVVNPNQFGSALQYFTGSKLHNVHLRTIAKNRGFKLSEYGFYKGEKLVASKTEEDCYSSLGMQYIPPELRTDTGEIEAAYRHELPKLIEEKDIRGDLHTHSLWSDGRNSIRDMALAAHKKGYEYIAMTDHSPSLVVARGLKLDRLKKKKKEIDELNGNLPIKILFGTEVDIMFDGSIDYPDEILKMFDVAVASIHSRFGQDNTERILRATENPNIHIIGHPSGRLIGERKPYPLNYEKIFKKAAETGTVLEINSQYRRLDLQDIYIREAKRWKCNFSINSDAHSTDGLDMISIGVKWAKRGWVEKKDVVNTRSWQELAKLLKN